MQNDQDQEPKNRWIWTAVILTVALAIITVLAYVYRFNSYPIGPPSAWAAFANYVTGIMTPIVGMATLILLVKTLLVQREELRLQRLELHRQGSAAEESATALENQLRAMFIQNFEQSFFSWLNTYQKMIFSIYDDAYKQSGLPVIAKYMQIDTSKRLEIQDAFFHMESISDEATKEERAEEIFVFKVKKWLTQSLMPVYQTNLKPSTHAWIALIKWVDEHKTLHEDEKREYIAILKAHLSETELVLLYFHCLFSERNDFQANVEKYAILDGLRESKSHPYVNFYMARKINKLSSNAFGVQQTIESATTQ